MRPNDVIQAMYGGKTLVFGHRGARAYAPMNTILAFELAVEQGAHGIELDVHRSADGYPVIVHDFTVDSTTNGTGRVDSMTLAQLKALDAGSTFDASFAGVQIPTLDEVFEAVGKQLFVNVEIKSITTETDGVEQVVADCIARHNMGERVVVSSFNPLALLRFRAISPDVPIGFLYARESPEGVFDALKDTAYEAFHPHDPLITAEFIAPHLAAGRVINAWTVNDPVRAAELRNLGVGGIITDQPDTILAAL